MAYNFTYDIGIEYKRFKLSEERKVREKLYRPGYRGSKIHFVEDFRSLFEAAQETSIWDVLRTKESLCLSQNELDKVLKLASNRCEANPKLRYGQAIWNQLFTHHRFIALQIRGTELDPFYDDAIIVRLIHILVNNYKWTIEKYEELYS